MRLRTKIALFSAVFWGGLLLINVCKLASMYATFCRATTARRRSAEGTKLAELRLPWVLSRTVKAGYGPPGTRSFNAQYVAILGEYRHSRRAFKGLVGFAEADGLPFRDRAVWSLRRFPRKWVWPKVSEWAFERDKSVPVDASVALPYEKDWSIQVDAICTMLRMDLERTLKELRKAIRAGLENPTEEFDAFSRSFGRAFLCQRTDPQRAALADFLLHTYGAGGEKLPTMLSTEAYEAILQAVRELDDSPTKDRFQRFQEMTGDTTRGSRMPSPEKER